MFSSTTTTMGIEEQKEEREVLDSIFPEEITGDLLQLSIGLEVDI